MAGLTDPFALVAIRGKFAGRIVRVAPEEGKVRWTVGRSEDADISLAGDDEVSSQHAIISCAAQIRTVLEMDNLAWLCGQICAKAGGHGKTTQRWAKGAECEDATGCKRHALYALQQPRAMAASEAALSFHQIRAEAVQAHGHWVHKWHICNQWPWLHGAMP